MIYCPIPVVYTIDVQIPVMQQKLQQIPCHRPAPRGTRMSSSQAKAQALCASFKV